MVGHVTLAWPAGVSGISGTEHRIEGEILNTTRQPLASKAFVRMVRSAGPLSSNPRPRLRALSTI